VREAAVRTRAGPAVETRLPPLDRPAASLPPSRTLFAGSIWSPAAAAAAAAAWLRARARIRPPAALRRRRAAAGLKAAAGLQAFAGAAAACAASIVPGSLRSGARVAIS
jgi:hypothetical protein